MHAYDEFAYRTKVHELLHLFFCAVWWQARQVVEANQLSRVVDRIDYKYWSLDELIGILYGNSLDIKMLNDVIVKKTLPISSCMILDHSLRFIILLWLKKKNYTSVI